MNRELLMKSKTSPKKRLRLLFTIEAWSEIPVIILAAIWLILLFVELVWGLTPFLETIGIIIWIIFVIDFAIRFILSPRKSNYLKLNWLTAISLILPALRIFRVFMLTRAIRLARLTGSFRLMKILGSLYRGMNALRRGFSRHGLGYIIVFTVIVILIGAAGILEFEKNVPDPGGIHDYGEALWWTAMIMTTAGSAYWPKTVEGRILCFFLALYAFGIFGYITARFAAFIVGRDAQNIGPGASDTQSITLLRNEFQQLGKKIDFVIDKFHNNKGENE